MPSLRRPPRIWKLSPLSLKDGVNYDAGLRAHNGKRGPSEPPVPYLRLADGLPGASAPLRRRCVAPASCSCEMLIPPFPLAPVGKNTDKCAHCADKRQSTCLRRLVPLGARVLVMWMFRAMVDLGPLLVVTLVCPLPTLAPCCSLSSWRRVTPRGLRSWPRPCKQC